VEVPVVGVVMEVAAAAAAAAALAAAAAECNLGEIRLLQAEWECVLTGTVSTNFKVLIMETCAIPPGPPMGRDIGHPDPPVATPDLPASIYQKSSPKNTFLNVHSTHHDSDQHRHGRPGVG
jgi:hypothetical protein